MPDEFDAHLDPVPDFVSDFNPSSGADFEPAPGFGDFSVGGIDPVTGAALAGAAVTLGTGFGTSALSAQEGKKSRKFTEYMYRNRRQMEVADLKAAGLNPILAAGNMGGGSPSTGIARQDLGDPGGAMSKLAGTALASKKLEQELKNMTASERQLVQLARESEQKTKTSASQMALYDNQAALLDLQIPAATNQANIELASAGQTLAWGDRIMRFLPHAAAAAGGIALGRFPIKKGYTAFKALRKAMNAKKKAKKHERMMKQ